MKTSREQSGLQSLVGTRRTLVGLAVLAWVAVAAVMTAVPAEAQSPQVRDLFGTVVSIDGNVLVLTVQSEIVNVTTTAETTIRLPSKPDATIADLAEGDVVAVSLEEEDGALVADKIFLVPGKTQSRHVPGDVTSVTDTHITIQPLGARALPLMFTRTASTTIEFHKGATELTVGSFVIVVAVRDPLTGALRPAALEIHAAPKKSPAAVDPSRTPKPEPVSTADIEGLFEGVSTTTGRWIVSGTEVVVDADTRIEDGIAVGQWVDIEAEILADGSVHALRVEAKGRDRQVSARTKLEGIFQGVDRDDENVWLVSGTRVLVQPSSDTDGLPYIGQKVKVQALLQEDGTLLAREIENKGGLRGAAEPTKTKLEGVLQRIEGGTWTVSGVAFSVATTTRVRGTPVIGGFVKVEAVMVRGEVVARRVETERGPGGKVRREAELEGTISSIFDAGGNEVALLPENATGTIVIGERVRIDITLLTERDGDLRTGASVEVEAAIQGNALFAREVKVKRQRESSERADARRRRSTVEVEGVIDAGSISTSTVTSTFTFTVGDGGITVVVDTETEVKGRQQDGATVEIEGTVQEDGSILAEEVTVEDPEDDEDGKKVRFRNVTAQVSADGTALTVEGETLRIDRLTEGREDLKPGSTVQIKKLDAIRVDGTLVVTSIELAAKGNEGKGKGNEGKSQGKGKGNDETEEVEFKGIVATVTSTDTSTELVLSDGTTIVVNEDTEVEGTIAVGVDVQGEGVVSGGVIVATEVEVEASDDD